MLNVHTCMTDVNGGGGSSCRLWTLTVLREFRFATLFLTTTAANSNADADGAAAAAADAAAATDNQPLRLFCCLACC